MSSRLTLHPIDGSASNLYTAHVTTTQLLYRLARASADTRAVRRSVQTGSPMPIVKRVIRRKAGRTFGRAMRGLLR